MNAKPDAEPTPTPMSADDRHTLARAPMPEVRTLPSGQRWAGGHHKTGGGRVARALRLDELDGETNS